MKIYRTLRTVGMVAAAILLLCAANSWAFQAAERKALPDLDKRQPPGGAQKALPADRAGALRELETRVPGAKVDFAPVTGSPRMVSVSGGFLTGRDGKGAAISAASLAGFGQADPHRVTKAFLKEHRTLFGHGPEALDQARVSRDYTTSHNGLRTVIWEQQVDGIPVFQAVLISHTTSKGELVSISDQFVSDAHLTVARGNPKRAALMAAPGVSARQALAIAAQGVGEELTAEKVAVAGIVAAGAEQRQKLTAPGLSGESEAKLIWVPTDKDALHLCWDIVLTSRQRGEMFRVLVDVATGEVLVRQCLTKYISDASYRVFTSDSPSPFSPGHSTPLTNQPPIVPRTLVTLPALNTNASPNGWIDDGVNETRGNNADAHTDRNADNSPDLPRPQGSPFRVFDFPMDLTTQDPTNYAAASVVQLFYVCNWMHDRLYELGFTEAAGNFQVNNFGRGGFGNDAVQADALDGSGTDNANMSTPPDGSAPRMQMYIFTQMSPRRDGDLDAEIVIHEYTHGLSWRLVGGGQALGTSQSDGMGEGWSDWYALALLSDAGDNLNGCYAAGAYASHRIGGPTDLQNYYFGIRRYPYSTDLAKNPLTFKDIDPAQADNCSSGAPYHTAMFGPCSTGNADEVHAQGEVWCVALWEARANLIAKYGWAVGNQLILQLVTDGMKLTPPQPNFLQARDGILQADLINNGGANLPELWAGFAKRGMGFSATSPSSTTTAGVHESFDVPDVLRITPATGFTSRGEVGGPFDITSQLLVLTNTGAGAFTWTLVNTSAWLNVAPTGGTLAAGTSVQVTASLNGSANTLPLGIYTSTVWFSNHVTGARQSRAYTLRVGQIDYFTESFTGAGVLAFQSFTFTPNGSANFYAACREVATNFPTDPTGGTTVLLGDDTFLQISLPPTNTIAIYNRRTNVFFIGSNGYLTMNAGDANLSGSFLSHFSLPRVSALFKDLYPGSGGTTSWKQTADRVAVTFLNVREFGGSATVSFQIEMFYDGRIRLTYLQVSISFGLAGLSAGQGIPPGFEPSNFILYPECAPPDSLRITPTTGLIAQGYEGGPFTPSSITYTLSNVGTNPLNWSASRTQAWVTLSTMSGLLIPGATTNVVVSLNAQANSLIPGAYADRVDFTNLTSGFPQGRAVVLQVLAIPGEIAVLDSIPPAADLQMAYGDVINGVARLEHITVTNTDPTYGLIISNISFGLFVENFDDGLAQDWVPANPSHWQVIDGDYRAQSGSILWMFSRYVGRAWGDLAVEMSCRRTGNIGNSAAVVLRATANFEYEVGSAYIFQVATEGSYSVWKQVNGAWSWLQPWTTSPAINPGVNVLKAVAEGQALSFYINGTLVWSGTDSSLTSGFIGLGGFSDGTTHFLDNVSVGDPPAFALVGAQQQWFNERAGPGGNRAVAPAVPAPVYPGTPDPLPSVGSLAALTLTSGPFRLENVPEFPYALPPHGALTFDVIYRPKVPGSNDAKVVIDSNDDDESRVEVQLTGRGILDYLLVTPAASLVSQGHPGGPFSPGSVTYILSNGGPTTINWTVSHTQTWVSALPSGGALAVGQSVNVTVGFAPAANSLPEGLHRDLITFSNVTTTRFETRNVSLTVFTSPIIAVTPASMSVTNAEGRSTNVTLVVSNALVADGNLTFRINAQETGRSIQSIAAAGVGLPPAGRDFTELAPNKEYKVDRLLVRFAAGVQAVQRAQMLNALGGAQVIREYKVVPGLCLVKLPAGQAVAQALQTFNRMAGIIYAEPDYRVKAIATPNDARFGELWGMHNTGQTGGTPDADIDAPAAWDLHTGSRDVVVAVIDTGVDYTHPDLTNNIWINPGEIPGNGIDDDNNGFVDDLHGYDFVNGDGDPMDDHYHGTHCAGTIGAEGNNGIGVAGVCWKVRIMALKFLDDGGGGNTADAISAIEYATLMGARVMNNSWGGGGYEQSLKDAIDAAGAANVVFVAAAGNDGSDNDATPFFPAGYDSTNILSVMATDHDDLRSGFSNFGLTTVDLAGPGTDVLSCEPGGGYQLLSGTSMSTPHLAGACALLLSANPLLNVASLKQALISTVDTNLPGLCVAGGRLNLARALASVGAAWITVAPSGGTNVAPGAFVNVTVGFHAGDLAAGSYTGRLVIACNDLITPSVTIPVSMRIVADSLQVTPSSVFSSVGAEGGPFAPSAMAYTVTNTGGSSLNWAVAHTQNWVSVSANSGSLAAGASLVVTGWINSAASLLSTGIYADTLVFSNTVSGAIRPRPVALSVVTPALSIADASVLEGNSGTTSAVFTVTLIPATVRTVSVAYATANGTAQSGSDYAATNNVLTFLPGQTNATVRVIVIGDTNAEPTEIFFVNLTSPVQAVLERSQATGRILADDVGPFFDDFEPAIDLLQWAEFGGSVGSTVLATNHGGFVSGPNSLWFGATTNRYVASRSLDATLGGVVDFWLCIASGTGFPWEQADLPEEGIVLEYSINSGGSWVEFGRYDTAIYTTWTHVTAEIPGAAQTGDTQFRWRQLSHSDDCCDHWALDDVTAFVGPRPPTIIAQPASRTVTLGGTASFSVRAFGSNPLSYQWRKDGFNLMDGGRISGALSNRLTIANVLTNDAGFYSVLVTNLYGQALSPNAVLTVEIPQPPSVPFGPLPTNNATGISVHTLLSWNNAGGESLEHGATTLVELINPAATYMNGDGVGSARGLFLVSDRDLTISSVGFSVETPPGIALTANLYGTVAASTRGALLASNTSVTAGAGKIWHDVPLTYTLQAGVEYNLEFAQPSLFTSLLYLDDRDDAPFTIDGVTARDGEYLGDASNFAMGQFRLATDGGYGQAKYAVYFGTNAAALPLIATNLTQPTCNPGTLAFNTTYYWQVVASNIVGSATGAVWTFTTTLDEVRFASATNSVAENGGSALITVVRENPAGGAFSVHYSTSNGTATAGADYTAVSGTLTFAPGVLSTNFLIPILDDNLGEGNETVQLRLSLPSPNVLLSVPSNAVLIIVDNDVLTLGEALDATQLTWTTGGDASWLTQTTNTHDGLDAARSGFIDHGEESWVETTVVGPGTLSFWWKVSSESCCDPLSFFVDGVFHTSIAGESGWTQQTFPIATGTHVLRWSYSKDGSVVNGLDAGLVDQVSYVPALGVLHHFAWSPIASTQRANVPFPVMLTAQDGQGNTVSNFTGPVALSGLVRSGVATNTILGPLIHSDLFPGTFTIGYILTPNADLAVTHLRHYWGTKVSIWNDAGTLLGSQNVVSTPGAWVETPLSTPVTLLAGNRYRVGAYSSGSNYYWLTNGPTNFASGTIDLGCYSNGDAFPTTTFSTDFNYLVDLRYTVAAYTNIPITPASASNFVAGLWTGMVTVPSVATNATLLADDGSGHFGVSNPFNVLPDTRPVLLIVRGPGGMVDLSFASLPGVNYVLEYKNSLSDVVWIPLQAFVGDGTIKTRTDTPGPAVPQRFYRLRLP